MSREAQERANVTQQLLDEGWGQETIDVVLEIVPVTEVVPSCKLARKVEEHTTDASDACNKLIDILTRAVSHAIRLKEFRALGFSMDRLSPATVDHRLRGAVAALGGDGTLLSPMPTPSSVRPPNTGERSRRRLR